VLRATETPRCAREAQFGELRRPGRRPGRQHRCLSHVPGGRLPASSRMAGLIHLVRERRDLLELIERRLGVIHARAAASPDY